MNDIYDKLWLWGHEPGTHDHQYGLPATSRMTAAEAAYYFGVPNVLMIGIGDIPTPPFDQHMIAFRPLRRVVWSVVGDSSSSRTDLDAVLDLVPRFPNLCGAIMDDFFHASDEDGSAGRLGLEQLRQLRHRLRTAQRPLDLWVTLYAHDFQFPIQLHLDLVDVVTFWTWTADQLPHLEHQLSVLDEFVPNKRKVLGCYLWDYGASQPMPLELMQHQCRVGLQGLQSGQLDGMIFLSNSACDQNLETVEWTREWIAQVGPMPLSSR